MSDYSPCSPYTATDLPIWEQLPTAERQQVLALLAQLAFNLVMAQWDWIQEEKTDAIPTEYRQD